MEIYASLNIKFEQSDITLISLEVDDSFGGPFCFAVLQSLGFLYNVRGGKPAAQQFLIRATFSSFSRPNHLEMIMVLKCLMLQDKTIFSKSDKVRV